jgi:phenylalanine-4-hydroxylase
MALLSRLQWWSVEYGLIGDINNPKIYGAGLLSSIGESASCMQPEVKKITYTIDALKVGYDITKEQPQLFVTPTFQNLIDVLAQFESTMAYRVGGLESILKAIECKNICTATFSSGIQVSGVFSIVQKDKDNKIKYINTNSPTTLCFNDQFLVGHGPDYHADGFGASLGQLLGSNKKLEDFTKQDLNEFGLVLEKTVQLNYENGIQVNGKLIGVTFKEDKLILMTFDNCRVTDQEGNFYFEPSWGIYDMAIGDAIISVFNGTADKSIFEDQLYVSPKRTYQQNYTQQDISYQNLFQQIRNYREQNSSDDSLLLQWETLKNEFKEDWLGALEILELAAVDSNKTALANEIRIYLNAQINMYPRFTKLINDGLKIIDTKLKFE